MVPQRCEHGGICYLVVMQSGVMLGVELGQPGDDEASSELLADNSGRWSRPRLMSTSPLSASLHVHAWPLNPVVYRESYLLAAVRELILGLASRLDAFSGYPFRT